MPEKNDDRGQHAGLAMIGLQVAIGVALGYFIGRWLDRRYGWGSRGVVIGSMLGLAGGLYLLIKDAIRINKD
jgi:hypothetical protein